VITNSITISHHKFADTTYLFDGSVKILDFGLEEGFIGYRDPLESMSLLGIAPFSPTTASPLLNFLFFSPNLKSKIERFALSTVHKTLVCSVGLHSTL
jgi:hypothetical protein